jgi:carboxyl-terminal processing protease
MFRLPPFLSIFFLMIFFSNHALAQNSAKKVILSPVSEKKSNQIKFSSQMSEQDIKRFALAMRYVQYNYVEDVKFNALFDHAIRGMVSGLDPHSEYLSEKDFKALKRSAEGQYVGIGIELTSEKGLIKVISPFDGSPAAKAGIKPGDLILKVNDLLVSKVGLGEAINAIRGPKNTKLTLVVVRKGEDKPIKLELMRQSIQISSVHSRHLPNNMGYIRIAMFNEKTAADLKKTIRQMNKKKPVGGLILDMRNNPGGILLSSIQVADLFLDAKKMKNKVIVQMKGRHEQDNRMAYAHKGDVLHGKPIVVLVNRGSASASEIVAAALQEHNRAVVVGTRTFGKGSIQSVFLMDEDSALKLTIALYFTPYGHSIQGNGVEPDVYVPYTRLPKTVQTSEWLKHFKESNYRRSLTSKKQKQHKRNQLAREAIQEMAKNDFQLYQAFSLAQGMHSLRS